MNEQAIAEARTNGYLINRSNNQELREAWMAEVRAVAMPYVEIVHTRDGIGLTWHVGHLRPHLADAAQAVAMAYTKQHPGIGVHFTTPALCTMGSLPLNDAMDLAGRILDLAPGKRVD